MAQLLCIALFLGSIFMNFSLTFTSKISDSFAGDFLSDNPQLFKSFDKELINFIEKFAHSSSGSLLASIVNTISHGHLYELDRNDKSSSFMVQTNNNKQYPDLAVSTDPLDGINIGPPQRSSIIITCFITFLLSVVTIPFVILVIFGGDDLMCIKAIVSINAYGLGVLTLALFYDYLPDWLLCLLSLLVGVSYGAFYYNTFNIEEIVMIIFIFFSVLGASFIYNLYAALPFEIINPSFCGFAGIIFNIGIFDRYFVFLRLLYFVIILIIASCVYASIPPSVREFSISEKAQNSLFVDYIFCFCAAWPCAGFITQIFYLTNLADFNPIDPLSFFHVPCQFRLNRWETYFSILTWVTITEAIRNVRAYYGQGSELTLTKLSRKVMERWDYATSQ